MVLLLKKCRNERRNKIDVGMHWGVLVSCFVYLVGKNVTHETVAGKTNPKTASQEFRDWVYSKSKGGHMLVTECEGCGKESTKCCASLEQAMLWFCDACYKTHVREAHRGEPLPGAPSV